MKPGSTASADQCDALNYLNTVVLLYPRQTWTCLVIVVDICKCSTDFATCPLSLSLSLTFSPLSFLKNDYDTGNTVYAKIYVLCGAVITLFNNKDIWREKRWISAIYSTIKPFISIFKCVFLQNFWPFGTCCGVKMYWVFQCVVLAGSTVFFPQNRTTMYQNADFHVCCFITLIVCSHWKVFRCLPLLCSPCDEIAVWHCDNTWIRDNIWIFLFGELCSRVNLITRSSDTP